MELSTLVNKINKINFGYMWYSDSLNSSLGGRVFICNPQPVTQIIGFHSKTPKERFQDLRKKLTEKLGEDTLAALDTYIDFRISYQGRYHLLK